MKLLFLLFCFILIFIVGIVAAGMEIDASVSSDGIVSKLNLPVTPTNFSLLPTVNSSDFWDDLDTPADILGSSINNDLNWINWFQNWTDGAGASNDLTTSGEGGFGGLMPYDSATFDLGSGSLKWRNLIMTGDITTLGDITATGDITTGNIIALQGNFTEGIVIGANITYENNVRVNNPSESEIKWTGKTGGGRNTTFAIDFDDTTFGPTLFGKTTRDGTERIFVRGLMTFADAASFNFGNSNDAGFQWATSGPNDFLKIKIGTGSSGQSGNIVIIDRNTAPHFTSAYPIQTNPTLRIQAKSTNQTHYIEFNHNTSDAIITIGSGSLFVNTSIISSNVFIPQYMFAHNDATMPILGVGVWTNISFDQEDTDIKFGISHTYDDSSNQTFMIMQDGIYEVDYDLDLQDTSVGASDINVAARLVNMSGAEVIGSVFETDITKQGVEAELSHDFLIEAYAGDSFVVQFVASDSDVQVSTHGTFGDHPESATITIIKVANL